MICVRLIGGLGNQLFQYATGRALSIELGRTLRLDISGFQRYRLRQFSLGGFPISLPIESQIQRLGRIVCTRLLPKGFGQTVLRERQNFAWDRDLQEKIKKARVAYLDGYWQHPNYFNSIREDLRRDLRFNLPAKSRKFEEFRRRIEAAPHSVSLHVRRGDFVSHPGTREYHQVVEWSYYENALKWMSSSLGTPQIFVFSDDPEWCRSELPRLITGIGSFETVSSEGELREQADFELMKLCRHHICANSTFSWWASYLASDPKGMVTLPERWTRDYATQTEFGLHGWKIVN